MNMRYIKRGIAMVVTFTVILAWSVIALAAGDANEAVNEARKGVLQINLLYVDDNGSEHLIQGGSGFLIGETPGADHIITNAHVVNMSDELKVAAGGVFGADFFSGDVELKVKVVVKRDVQINAAVVNQSEAMDFAILKLEQPIYDRTPLVLNTDMDKVIATDNVYALGFPAAIEIAQDATYYTSGDVNVMAGIVSKMTSLDSVGYIQHSAVLSGGNSGGPLVNSKGEVIGLNRANVDDTYFYSVQISEITEILDMLGIVYQEAEAGQESAQEDAIGNGEADKTVLSRELAAAQLKDLSRYSKDSAMALASAIANGNLVVANADATQTEVDSALVILQYAQAGLAEKEEGNLTVVIIAAVAVVIILGIVAAVFVTLSGGKKKKEAAASPRATYPGGIPRPYGLQEMPGPQSARPISPSVDTPFRPAGMPGQGAGETSVLNGGAGETSVLGGGAQRGSASLTRLRNAEHINISKLIFKIGKERSKVDYCIPDNSSISRHHATIQNRGGVYFLSDNGSTNATFLNGNRVEPGREARLENGDRFKLADEEFEFRC